MSAEPPPAAHPIFRLLDLMATHRDPSCGSAWDLAQTSASLAPYAIEEAYELAAAAEAGNLDDLKSELGDLLLQVVFHAQIARERGAFDFGDVAHATVDKMVRRRPPYTDGAGPASRRHDRGWERLKAAERDAPASGDAGLMAGLPLSLPALTRALKLSRRAESVGFVWTSAAEILEKLQEEIAELRAELERGDLVSAGQELGDILFVCANIGREIGVDPEAALRGANAKFMRRFAFIEDRLKQQGRSLDDAEPGEMDRLWGQAKVGEGIPDPNETPPVASARTGPGLGDPAAP